MSQNQSNQIKCESVKNIPFNHAAQAILEDVRERIIPVVESNGIPLHMIREVFFQKDYCGMTDTKRGCIYLQLRESNNQCEFLRVDNIIGQAIHQLVHLVYNNHDETFNQFYNSFCTTYQSIYGPVTPKKIRAIESKMFRTPIIIETDLQGGYEKCCFSVPNMEEHIHGICSVSQYELSEDVVIQVPQKPASNQFNNNNNIKLNTWICPRCTLENEGSSQKCNACDLEKPAISSFVDRNNNNNNNNNIFSPQPDYPQDVCQSVISAPANYPNQKQPEVDNSVPFNPYANDNNNNNNNPSASYSFQPASSNSYLPPNQGLINNNIQPISNPPVSPIAPQPSPAPTGIIFPAPMAPVEPKAPIAPVAPIVPIAPIAPQLPKAPVAPQPPMAPEAPKILITPQPPMAPKAPEAPKVPQPPKAPEAPKMPIAPQPPMAPVMYNPSINTQQQISNPPSNSQFITSSPMAPQQPQQPQNYINMQYQYPSPMPQVPATNPVQPQFIQAQNGVPSMSNPNLAPRPMNMPTNIPIQYQNYQYQYQYPQH
ncbi:hypothetical protein WA158_004476 [Blastocystis sp. Blastoise]